MLQSLLQVLAKNLILLLYFLHVVMKFFQLC